MIAYLRGMVREKSVDSVIVEVHGVGYRVSVSLTTLADLPPEGATAELRIHTHVREDALQLFGFATSDEEQLFRHLTTVSGVGPKLALTILSGMQPSELATALAQGEVARLTKISGVGKKTAERMVVELADKLKVSNLLSRQPAKAQRGDDLVSALLNLGYRQADAERAAGLAREQAPDADIGDLVRASLQMLMSKAV